MAAEAGNPVLVRVARRSGIAAALDEVGVDVGGAVLVLVGGAGGMNGPAGELGDLVRDAVVPVVERHAATVVDGGTDSGVMSLIGRARAEVAAGFTLVGVAAEGTVTVPGGDPPRADAVALETHHTHVLLVPGTQWGDEAPWISAVAAAVAGGGPSVTMLVNGGRIAVDDAERSLAAGRRLVVVAGSGRTADAIADARASGRGEPAVLAVAASPLTEVVAVDDPAAVAATVSAALTGVVGRG